MKTKKQRISVAVAKRVGGKLGVDLTGKIAWAHLKEFPDYYTRLDRLETEADAYWSSRR